VPRATFPDAETNIANTPAKAVVKTFSVSRTEKAVVTPLATGTATVSARIEFPITETVCEELRNEENNAVNIRIPVAETKNLRGAVNERLVILKSTLKTFETLTEKSFSKLISSTPISAKSSAVSLSIASAIL
jgi:hypothetical protein